MQEKTTKIMVANGGVGPKKVIFLPVGAAVEGLEPGTEGVEDAPGPPAEGPPTPAAGPWDTEVEPVVAAAVVWEALAFATEARRAEPRAVAALAPLPAAAAAEAAETGLMAAETS